ncbi:MAG: membrane dipeptidase, partial [Nitrososphaerota archaeon]
VGVTMIEPTLGGAADVKRVADHIMYIFENFGKNLVAIGTDFFGIMHVDEPKGLEDVTKFGNLWSELLSRGLTREDIELIAYRNALRVIMANSARWKPRIF